MIKTKRSKELSYVDHYFLNGWVYFSLGQIVFQLEYEHVFKIKTFYLQQSLYSGVHLLQFLNAVICSLIALFFKCIKLHQILPQFSTINLALALDINIFERDYSNLNNPIPSKDINLWYIYKVYCREQGQHLMQQKRRTLLALHFLKKYPSQDFFLNLVPKESFAPKCTFSINFRSQMKL